jgi:uncharacterized RDD family membrane protein YckC
MDSSGLTPGDPLGDDPRPASPAPAARPEAPGPVPATGGYGGGPVPPGAFSPPERPQRLGPETVYADWWRRVVAAILDGLIVGGVALLILAAFGLGFFADGGASTSEIVAGVILTVLVFALLALFYAPILMARTNGQTLGKMAVRIRVVRANGKRIDFWWAVLREVVVKGIGFGIAGSVTGGLANVADAIWPLIDKQDRALHDFVVDSRVVPA